MGLMYSHKDESLNRPRPFELGFFARSLVLSTPPTKLFFHDAGFNQAFRSFTGGLDYFKECFEGPLKRADNFWMFPVDYYLGVLWGDGGAPVLDLFGYQEVDLSDRAENWKENIDYQTLIIKSGSVVPKNEMVFCEDSAMMRGLEGIFRRSNPNFKHYIKNFPDLGTIEDSITLLPATI